MSLRVLHVIPSVSPKHGGPSFALPLFARAAMAKGATVAIATTDDDGPGAHLDVPLNQFMPGPGGATCIYFRKNTEAYKVSLGLARWLRAHVADFEVVHIDALFSFSSYAAARAARRAGVPYIVRPLGVLNRWGLENRRRILKQWSLRLIELPILRGAAAIHYTAEAERDEAATAHPDIGSVRSAVIPIPVEPAPLFDSTQAQKRFPITAGRRVILFLSRLHVKKGIELLLPAFAQLRTEFPDALLVVAGSGEPRYVESLQEKARTLGCDSDILWPGFVAGDDKAALLSTATLFVLPSFSENFGIAAAEALAMGVPSILTDGVAIGEDARAAEAALVVPCETVILAVAMRQLLENKELRDQLSRRGQAMIRERFSAAVVGSQLRDLYVSVLSKSGKAHG